MDSAGIPISRIYMKPTVGIKEHVTYYIFNRNSIFLFVLFAG